MALNPNDPNVAMLEVVAHRLGDALRRRLVFIGGSVVGLLITDPAMPNIRPTEDVDLVAQVLARAEFNDIEMALRAQGFRQDMSPDAPICRWRIDQTTVDVMPTLEAILGFSNRWYPLAVESAVLVALPSGIEIQMVQAPVFVATKLEAFHGRGQNDHLFSHDLGDLISVIDGREALLEECVQAPEVLKRYLAAEIQRLMSQRAFMDALPGHLPSDAASQSRLPDLEARLQQLARL
ncbi:nucleotidyl transferase AbiEii/AbiGii toxin family protein [Aquabacterium soli]|nr:nucleotidyl transferase AbiEii/AbiGii toxin family protein [Aquabacterium soli]